MSYRHPNLRRQASEAGLRIIGIDRPGYGLSTPQPGRTIAGWVPEALAVAGHLGIGQFATVGISTGGAYAPCGRHLIDLALELTYGPASGAA